MTTLADFAKKYGGVEMHTIKLDKYGCDDVAFQFRYRKDAREFARVAKSISLYAPFYSDEFKRAWVTIFPPSDPAALALAIAKVEGRA